MPEGGFLSPAITWRQGQFKGWDCYLIQTGSLELVLVPQVGGRVMGCSWNGYQLFFTQPEREGRLETVASTQDVRARKRAMGMPLWGGDKTWLAPQSRWTDGVPFLDLDSAPYDLQVKKSSEKKLIVEMKSHVCRETGMQITRTLDLSSDTPGWRIRHRLQNCSTAETEWEMWIVSMVLQPGRVFLPRSRSSTYPGGVKTFVEEGESVAARQSIVGELGSLAVIECMASKQFKYGVDSREGWILGVLDAGDGLIGYRKEVPFFPEATYAHGCVSEVFNSGEYSYLEMESHGPTRRLSPGESYEVEEEQSVFDVPKWPQSEDEVRALLTRKEGV